MGSPRSSVVSLRRGLSAPGTALVVVAGSIAGLVAPPAAAQAPPPAPPAATPAPAAPDTSPAPRAPADSDATVLRILPVVGGAPETGAQGGVTVVRLFRAGRGADAALRDAALRPSTDQLFAIATTRGQLRVFVERDAWFDANRRRLNARLELQRFPQPYFGLGPDAPAAAKEWYTADVASGFLTLQQALPRRAADALARVGAGGLARGAYLQGTYRLITTDVVRREADGALAAPGAPLGAGGSRVAQVELGALWDTRDNVFAPARGALVQLVGARADRLVGSQLGFSRATLDARAYRAVAPRTVLAAQLFVDGADGAVPFDQLPQVGGATVLRGYLRGRWRDAVLGAAQVEVRQALPWRLGVVAWGGAGGVGPSLARAVDAPALLPTYGLGLRWMLLPRERANLRLDWARGRGATGLYVGFAEAF